MCGRALRNVWYLAEIKDVNCLVRLAMTLSRTAFPARERIAASNTLKIVTKGIVAKGGDLLYAFNFDSWGEDITLHLAPTCLLSYSRPRPHPEGACAAYLPTFLLSDQTSSRQVLVIAPHGGRPPRPSG